MSNSSPYVFFLLSCRYYVLDWRLSLFQALDGAPYYHLRLGRQSILTDPRSGEIRTYSLTKLFALVKDVQAKTPDDKTPVYFVSTAAAVPSMVIVLRLLLRSGLWLFDVYDDYSLYWGPRFNRLKGHWVNWLFYRTMTATLIAPPNLREKFSDAYDLEVASDVPPLTLADRNFGNLIVTSNLDGRLDYAFVAGVARECPDGEIHIYGRINNSARDKPALDALLATAGNVKYCGTFPDQRLPQILSDYGVALAPFRTNVPYTYSTDPIRFYDYLNAGLEVISTDIPRARDRSNFIHIAARAEEAAAMWKRVRLDPAERKAKRWNAAAHSWRFRAQQFIEIVSTLVARDGGT